MPHLLFMMNVTCFFCKDLLIYVQTLRNCFWMLIFVLIWIYANSNHFHICLKCYTWLLKNYFMFMIIMYVCLHSNDLEKKPLFFPLIMFHVARILYLFWSIKIFCTILNGCLLNFYFASYLFKKNICHVTNNLDISMMQTIF